jgi:undecaprenyl-diphosphatase
MMDWVMRVVTDSGLGHAQLTALFAVAMRRRVHWGWILGWSLLVMAGGGWYEVQRYGKPPTVAMGYLLCLGLFWRLEPRHAGGALVTSVLTGLSRLLFVKPIGRQRPSNLWFSQPMEPIFGATSFPSGHTTTTFAMAVFLVWALRGRGMAWWIVVWAVLVGVSRIYVGVHYPLDIVAGAALGAVGGSLGWMVADWFGWLDNGPDRDEASTTREATEKN